MAGMARVMGATLTGVQNCSGKIKICDLQFFESLFFAPYNHLLQSCINAAPLSNALKSGVLRQHHQALWQNWGIVTQHEGQIL